MDAAKVIEASMAELREGIAGLYAPLASIEDVEAGRAEAVRREVAAARRAGFNDGKKAAKRELLKKTFTAEQVEEIRETAYAAGFAEGVEQAMGRRR